MEVKFCGACGSKIQEGSKFCSSCGWSVATVESQAAPITAKDQQKTPVTPINHVQHLAAEPFTVPKRSGRGSGFIALIFIISLVVLAGALLLTTDKGLEIKEVVLEQWDSIFNKDSDQTADQNISHDATSNDKQENVFNNSSDDQVDDLATDLLVNSVDSNIQKDVTFEALQGNYMGVAVLIGMENIDKVPGITEAYILEFEKILNQDLECTIEVWNEDLEVSINIEAGMDIDIEDCTLEEGVITQEMIEEEEGIVAALVNKAVVLKEDGIYVIVGEFKLSFGEGSLTYSYHVKKIEEE